MPAYFATQALLAEGWAHNVRLDVDAAGMLTAITPDSTAQDAVRLSGPVIPGMPNLHSHAFQRVMAGLAEVAGNPQDSFWTWRDLISHGAAINAGPGRYYRPPVVYRDAQRGLYPGR